MRNPISKTLLALTCILLSSEAVHATEKSSWIGEWLLYDPTSMKTNPDSRISVTDFDGELIFSSIGLEYSTEPGKTRVFYLGNSACDKQTFSKDNSKVMFKYSGCVNREFDGERVICQIRSASEEANSMIVCSNYSIDKYFKKIIKKP